MVSALPTLRQLMKEGRLEEGVERMDERQVRSALIQVARTIDKKESKLDELFGMLGPWRTMYFRWVCEKCPGQSEWIRQEFLEDVLDAAEHHHEEVRGYFPEHDFAHDVYIERRSVVNLSSALNLDDPRYMMVLDGHDGPRELAYKRGDETLTPPTDADLGLDVPKNETVPHGVFVGVAASPGTAEGRAVWIDRKDGFSVDPDELPETWVLVSDSTDPSLVPLMKKCEAIVTERGGMSSHAAHVARELGTPCVTQVFEERDTLERLDGEMLRVEGDRGLVEVLD